MISNSAIAIRMTAASVFMKMIVYTMNWQQTNYEKVYFFMNVFILMTGIFFGIRNFKKRETVKTNFMEDLKAGMKVAAMYAIFLSLFVFFYYKIIDPNYFAVRLEEQINAARESNLSAEISEQINIEQARQTGEFVLSAFFQSTITLIGFIILGSFYSSLIAFFLRKIKGFGNNV